MSRSAISRAFVVLSVQQLAEWMSQLLGGLKLRVVQIDVALAQRQHDRALDRGRDPRGQA